MWQLHLSKLMRLLPLAEVARCAPSALDLMGQVCFTEWRAIYEKEYNCYTPQAATDMFLQMCELQRLPYCAVLLDEADQFVGCFAAQLEDDVKDFPKPHDWVDGPWLVCMYVMPQHRGKGLMRLLLNHIIEWCDTHLTEVRRG